MNKTKGSKKRPGKRSVTAATNDLVPRGGDVGVDANQCLAKVPRRSTNITDADTDDSKRVSQAAFSASLFKLQITELLKEVRMKQSRRQTVLRAIEVLNKILHSTPPGTMEDLRRVKSFTPTARLPLHLHPKTTQGTFNFLPPTRVAIVGAFLIDGCVKPQENIDVAVTMPKACFREKDYLNHRYIRKRALYLCHLADHLAQHESVADVRYTCRHGNHLKPQIILQITVDHSRPISVHLHPVPEGDTFPVSRLHYSSSNVRTEWWRGSVNEDVDQCNVVTPRYNAAILSDLFLEDNNALVKETIGGSQSVREGVCLLKVWANQRQLATGYGAVSGFILTMFVCYLLKRKKLNLAMNSYQVLTTVLKHITLSDWSKKPISMRDHAHDQSLPPLDETLQYYDVVFMDASGTLNFCAEVNCATYARFDLRPQLKHEASLSLAHINSLDNAFESLLMTPVSFARKFDHIFHIDGRTMKKVFTKSDWKAAAMDYGGDFVHAATPTILRLLDKALGTRAHLVQCKLGDVPQWTTDTPAPDKITDRPVTFGILLNLKFASNVLEKGPSADSIEAEAFREMWGDRSNMRRFQDGTICEAVVWDAVTIADRSLVPRQIVEFILNRHANVSPSHVVYRGGQLDALLYRAPTAGAAYGTGEEQSLAVQAAYGGLAKILRSLELPLAINAIQGTSPALRSTEVFPAMGVTSTFFTKLQGDRRVPVSIMPCPLWMPSHTVICTLEDSAKWPDDPGAISRVKAALYVKLAALIKQHVESVHLRVDSVDVVKESFVFRLVLASGRELSAMKRVTSPDGMVKIEDTRESLALHRATVASPLLSSTLNGIHVEHVAFGNTARLAKRWISSQMLGHHVRQEAVELLVAYIFLHPAPFTPPSCGMSGFLRFLRFLSTFDWNMSPLIVNLNHDFTQEDMKEIEHDFQKNRAAKSLMCIVTPLDRDGGYWTSDCPTPPILTRLCALAHSASQLLEQQVLSDTPQTDFKVIFRPSLDDYNVLIHLNPDQLPRRHEAVDPYGDHVREPYPSTRAMPAFPVVEYDPVQCYLRDLRNTFGHLALFFHDDYGGNVIGVLWKPNAFESQPFSVPAVAGRKPCVDDTGDDVYLAPCVDTLCEHFQVIGQQLVARVESQKRIKPRNKFAQR